MEAKSAAAENICGCAFAALPAIYSTAFSISDLRPKRSGGRDGIDVNEFVNLPHRCLVASSAHVRLNSLLAHGIDHGLI